jgi:hypothetical protein
MKLKDLFLRTESHLQRAVVVKLEIESKCVNACVVFSLVLQIATTEKKFEIGKLALGQTH